MPRPPSVQGTHEGPENKRFSMHTARDCDEVDASVVSDLDDLVWTRDATFNQREVNSHTEGSRHHGNSNSCNRLGGINIGKDQQQRSIGTPHSIVEATFKVRCPPARLARPQYQPLAVKQAESLRTVQSGRMLLKQAHRICEALQRSGLCVHRASVDGWCFNSENEALDYQAWLSPALMDSHERRRNSEILPRSSTIHFDAALRTSIHCEDSAESEDWQYVSRVPMSEHGILRLFAVKAWYAAASAFRALDRSEVLAAATTSISTEDPEWPYCHRPWDEQVALLLRLCSSFLWVSSEGTITIRQTVTGQTSIGQSFDMSQNAHYFMTRVCLKHLEEMDSRLVLRPWLECRYFRARGMNLPLYDYVVRFWHFHYSRAELYVNDLPARLQSVIQAAWEAERAAPEQNQYSDHQLGLEKYAEGVQLGVMLSRTYKFRKLELAYANMGANMIETNLSRSDEGLTCVGCASSYGQIDLTTSSPSSSNLPDYLDPTFDFSSWELVEPFDEKHS